MAKPISAVLERHLGRKDGLPLRGSAVFQIGLGRAAFDTVQVYGRDVIVIRLKVAPKLAGYMVPDPEWLVVMIPLVWSADNVFNGRVAERGDAFLAIGADGYSKVGSDRDTVAIGVRKPVALDACAGLSGLHPEDISFDDIVFFQLELVPADISQTACVY